MKNYRRNTGFTLVEMLVVIAIIGILMGILVPSLSRGREQARRTECASNLRQLYLGSMSHATDDRHEGHFPAAYSAEGFDEINDIWRKTSTGWVDWRGVPGKTGSDRYNPNDGGSPTDDKKVFWWGDDGKTCIEHGSIYEYIRDFRVYICPNFKRYVEDDGSFDKPCRSYVMNRKVSWGSFFRLQQNKKGMSRRMLYAEAGYDAKYGATWGLRNDGDDFDDSGSYYLHYYRGVDGMLEWEKERIGDWHRGKANVVFLDGHTECLDPSIDNNKLTEYICTGDYEPGQ